jgi:hypothetical protein
VTLILSPENMRVRQSSSPAAWARSNSRPMVSPVMRFLA